MRIDIITLFPERVQAVTEYGVTGRAAQTGIVDLHCWNPRDYTQDKHRTVDDKPYGGGPGMLMKVEPLHQAIQTAKSSSEAETGKTPRVIYLSPQGKRFDQQAATQMAGDNLILVSGRYEGIDERLFELGIEEEWSIGDYVLSGGELAAMVIIDSVTRLQPGALGDEDSAQQDSFMEGLLDHPHYTRPEEIEGLNVPDVLLGGNHQQIEQWRLKQALGKTWLKRPDLLARREMSPEEQGLLNEFKTEFKVSNKTSK